ncbi:MAG: ABC transporter substrate-binding protein [Thermoprotei archaeon]
MQSWIYRALIPILLFILVVNIVAVTPRVTIAQEAPHGPWVDEVVFIEESDPDKVLEMLKNNEIQVYFDEITDPERYQRMKEYGLKVWFSYALYYELTFNPVGPVFNKTGKLNPFAVARIREAMNYLVDRDYIANEILGGLAVPRYVAITPSFPDYARYYDTIYEIEQEYKYNFEKAKSIIFEEMTKLGAEYRAAEGKWYYNGEPVEIIFLIRTEDARRQIGDYVAEQLEKLGFTVVRRYGTSRELAPYWIYGDPAEGTWHIYTGGWITTVVSRDESDNFGFFYTKLGLPVPLWQAYKNDPEFYTIAERLWTRSFTSIEERDELMRKALWLSMKESQRIWLVNLIAPWPRRPEIEIAGDLAGGYSGSWLWPWTLRYEGQVGGSVKIAMPTVLVEPWNPVGGSDWIYDMTVIRATGEIATMPDPYTGLYWPQRVKKAEVYVVKGLPVRKTLDWVELKFVDTIDVPPDAWYQWNATTRRIETVGEEFPEGAKALVKVVVYYEDNLFTGEYKWHDGSPFDLADIVFAFILAHDRAQPDSPVYDESAVPSYESWIKMFKGFRIVQEDPLVIEYYTDSWYMDAEWMASAAANAFWPYYDYGPAPWHMVFIGWLAEADGKLAFTADKADALQVERTNYIAGPSLEILAQELERAINEKLIPYPEVLSKYITEDEALQRYQNLKKWYEEKGHFWVGLGPFYLEKVDTVAKQIVLRAYREHIDTADKWLRFSEPMIPEVSIEPIETITQGLPAEITVSITFKGQPYKVNDMEYVKYLLIHGGGKIVGEAEPVSDGEWKITLPEEQTIGLTPGAGKLIVIAVSKLVGKPTVAETVFTIRSVVGYVGEQIAAVRGDISSLEDRIDTIEGTIQGMQEDINAVKSDVAGMSGLVYGALVAGILGIIIGIIGIVIGRKK